MFELEEIIHQFTQRDEVIIRGEHFRLKNMVTVSENDILKMRIILESISNIEHIDIDAEISARIYKR